MSTDLTRRILENVPAELQFARRWVGWDYEVRGTKRTKVPLRVNGEGYASSTDVRTWGSLATALANCGRFYSGGIGYVFAQGDGLVGIDLDGCRDAETGELTPFAVDVMSRLCTYVEISVSGTGIHLIARGTLPGPRRRVPGIEMYPSGRFFCMTGQVLTPYGLEERTLELVALYAELFPPPPPDTGPSPPPSAPPPLDDGSILRIARRARNGPDFARLWSGDWSQYSSQSEADLALIRRLSFYTGAADQLDRLVSASGLGQRGKWRERPDYRRRSIARVLAQPGPRFGVGRAA